MTDNDLLQGELKELLLEKVDVQLEQQLLERQRVASRLEKLDTTIERLRSQRENEAQKALTKVMQEFRSPAPPKSRPAPAVTKLKRKSKTITLVVSYSAFRNPSALRYLAMKRILIFSLAALALCLPAYAADTIRPIDQRFASDDVEEVPSFRRHVLPLMGRLGCNGRACHGSFQGQGGFRLSLFGYDFEADHEALTKGDKPRVDLKKPAESLILQKPTMPIDHGGEKRFEVGQLAVPPAPPVDRRPAARAWPRTTPTSIASRSRPPRSSSRSRARRSQLKVIAHWSDGTREDVTPLCRFRTNDEPIATVDATGVVTILGKGDTHVVAFYDNGVAPVPVMLPVSDLVGHELSRPCRRRRRSTSWSSPSSGSWASSRRSSAPTPSSSAASAST